MLKCYVAIARDTVLLFEQAEIQATISNGVISFTHNFKLLVFTVLCFDVICILVGKVFFCSREEKEMNANKMLYV